MKVWVILLVQQFCYLHSVSIYLAGLKLLVAPFMFYTKKKRKSKQKLGLFWFAQYLLFSPSSFYIYTIYFENKSGPISLGPVFAICPLMCLSIHIFWKKWDKSWAYLATTTSLSSFSFFCTPFLFYTLSRF